MYTPNQQKIVMLPTSKIRSNPWNVNVMDLETFQMLVDDIKEHGVFSLHPIQVRSLGNGFYECVDGEHRCKAVQVAGFPKLPCVIMDVEEDEAREINYIKNMRRGTVDPLREAKLYSFEKKRGLSSELIRRKYNLRSADYVRQLLTLLRIEDEIVEIIPSSIRYSPSKMRLIAQIREPEKQKQFIKELAKHKDTRVKKLEEKVNKLLGVSMEEIQIKRETAKEKVNFLEHCPLQKSLDLLLEILPKYRGPDTCARCFLSQGCDEAVKKMQAIMREFKDRTRHYCDNGRNE